MQETSVISDVIKRDILKGMSASPKYIPSKYFYDDEGSRIFQDIMSMPEYYLTNSEFDILQKEKHRILANVLLDGEEIDLIELGAGDGMKTSVLIDHFTEKQVRFRYIPVDISEEAIIQLVQKMEVKFPGIRLKEQIGDYFEIMGDLNTCSSCKKLVLFLGSNIGNYAPQEALAFFRQLSEVMNPGDMVLTGFDLIKDPNIILTAYNDPAGHTRKFNMNLLTRLNRELGANFDHDKFEHYPVYDPSEKAARSYLLSKEKQMVYFKELDKEFIFNEWETIFTEMSRKFTELDISRMANVTGYTVKKNFFDDQEFFANSLWVKR